MKLIFAVFELLKSETKCSNKYSAFLKNPFADSLRNVQLITLGRLLVFWCNDMFSKEEDKKFNTVKGFVLVSSEIISTNFGGVSWMYSS